MNQIRYFATFSEFYQALGYQRTPVLPDFDILTFDESRHVGVLSMLPFRKSWYQIVFKQNPAKAVWLNTSSIESSTPLLLFNSPYHVYSWQLDPNLKGCILFFDPCFLLSLADVESEFPFFQLNAPNLIEVHSNDFAVFTSHITQLLAAATAPDPHQRQILQALLTAFLYRCKSTYQAQQQGKSKRSSCLALVNQFRQLVAPFYLEKRTVIDYAQLLNITPNYLSDIVRKTTGATARSFIVERLILEAKNRLRHTDLDINTIAYTLQFDEPTNFGKFFRNYTGLTPGQFRANGPAPASEESTSIATDSIIG